MFSVNKGGKNCEYEWTFKPQEKHLGTHIGTLQVVSFLAFMFRQKNKAENAFLEL